MKNKKIQDFLYNKNDIILAIVILIVAALLIYWRMNVIMDYPQTLAEATDTTKTTTNEATPDESSEPAEIFSDDKLTHDVKVTVSGGSVTTAVQSLVDAGLFDSYDQFISVCESANCNAEDIKASTFTFQAGSTKEDIAKQATK